jgi:hypothetical protein
MWPSLNTNPEWMEWLFNHPPFLVAFGAATWALTFYVLAVIDGWLILSKRFRLKGSFYGEVWPFRSGRMRFYVHFGNCLFVGADESGLYLAVFPLFRLWHPPLLIPWSEMSIISGERGLIFKTRELRLGREESIPLRISSSLVRSLRESAGEAWALESVDV